MPMKELDPARAASTGHSMQEAGHTDDVGRAGDGERHDLAASADPYIDVSRGAPSSAPVRSGVEIPFPPDERKRVDPTNNSPWNAFGLLIIEFANKQVGRGSGTLVGPSHVLTAAHNLFAPNRGGWATRVHYIPACNGANQPYAGCAASKIFVTGGHKSLSLPHPEDTGGYVDDVEKFTQDYGLVRLSNPTPLPFFGMRAASYDELHGGVVSITGYPGDKPKGEMWTDAGKLKEIRDLLLFYRISTFKGESGASLIAEIDHPIEKYIVGVHVAGSKKRDANFAVRLTTEKILQLQTWMAEG